MGCRTRVMGNVYDPTPADCLRPRQPVLHLHQPAPAWPSKATATRTLFYEKLEAMMELVVTAAAGPLRNSGKQACLQLSLPDGSGRLAGLRQAGPSATRCGEVLKHGTLSIGFIGLAETLTALYRPSPRRERGDAEEGPGDHRLYARLLRRGRAQDLTMNFTLLATPAEGLSGRFIRMDQEALWHNPRRNGPGILHQQLPYSRVVSHFRL